MKKKKLFVLSALAITLSLTACGGDPYASHIKHEDDISPVTPYRPYDNGKRIEKITLEENVIAIDLTNSPTYQIKASFEPIDAFNSTLIYSSNNPDIATVSQTGLITGVSNGETSIYVSSDEGISETCTVKVYTPVTAINIIPQSVLDTGFILDINDTKEFSLSFEPETTNLKEVTWSVIDEAGQTSQIATIDDKGLLTVSAPIKTKNTVNYVVATSKANPEIFASQKITINDFRTYADSVEIYADDKKVEEEITLELLESKYLTYVTNPKEISSKQALWVSSDPEIVEVSESGVITALKANEEGTTSSTITVYVDGISDSVVVNTKKIPVKSVELPKEEEIAVMVKDGTFQLHPIVKSDEEGKVPSNPRVNYVVDEGSEYISVDENGLITAKKSSLGLKVPHIKIVSEDNPEIFAECFVIISNFVQKIEINDPSFKELNYGGNTYQLSVTATPSDADPFTLHWESSDESLATIDENGLITTNSDNKAGEVTFTASVSDVGEVEEKSITFNVVKPTGEFVINKQYLVGNRDFTSLTPDYEKPSWNDSDYAKILSDEEVPSSMTYDFSNQWVLKDVTLYNNGSDNIDEFRIRGVNYPESCNVNPSSKNLITKVEGTDNYTVPYDGEFNIYYQQLTDAKAYEVGSKYWIYGCPSFKEDTFYLVGNKTFSTGESQNTGASWNYKSRALALARDTSKTEFEQYTGSASLKKNDLIRFRNDTWFDITLGTTSGEITENTTDDNFIVNEEGTYSFYLKILRDSASQAITGSELYYVKQVEPVEPTSVTLNKTELTLAEGSSETLTASVAPLDSTYKEIVWESSNPTLVSVNNGVVTALSNSGNSTITASIKDFPEIKATCTVTLEDAKPTTRTLYLNTGGTNLWDKDGATFAVWTWGDGVDGKCYASDTTITVSDTKVAVFTVPIGVTNALFLRLDGKYQVTQENEKNFPLPAEESSTGGYWNRTYDVDAPIGLNNYFIVEKWNPKDDQGKVIQSSIGHWTSFPTI